MKLADKLTTATVLLLASAISVRTYLDTERSIAHYVADIEEAQEELGKLLGTAVQAAWRTQGWQGAIELIKSVEAESNGTSIRWTWFGPQPRLEYQPQIPLLELLPAVAGAKQVTFAHPHRDGHVVTYWPVELPGLPLGALEFTRSTQELLAFQRLERLRSVAGSVILILSYAFLHWLLGRRLVARPVSALISHVHRIGRGDAPLPLPSPRADELGALAQELHQISADMSSLQAGVLEERRSRVAVEQQLTHADRLATVGRLTAAVVHDVGTPLNVISGRARLIAEGQAGAAEVPEFARRIAEQSERMATTLRRLLEFGKKARGDARRCSVAGLLEETCALLQPVAHKSRVSICLSEVAPDLHVWGDPQELRQVLTNLLNNAIQAMPHGGEVTVEAQAEEGPAAGKPDLPMFAIIRVTDGGPGVSDEVRAHLFEPFYTTKAEGGTGLGLSVSKSIIERHGGYLELSPQLKGRGATFTVGLPLEGSS